MSIDQKQARVTLIVCRDSLKWWLNVKKSTYQGESWVIWSSAKPFQMGLEETFYLRGPNPWNIRKLSGLYNYSTYRGHTHWRNRKCQCSRSLLELMCSRHEISMYLLEKDYRRTFYQWIAVGIVGYCYDRYKGCLKRWNENGRLYLPYHNKNCGSIGSSSFDSFSMLNRDTYDKSYLVKT